MPGHAGKDGLNNFKKHQALQESHSPNFNKSIHSLLPIREEAESVLVFTNITAEERRQYAAVVEKCEEFFQVRKNIIFEKARFNRNQQAGETAEQYNMALYTPCRKL